MPLHHDGKLHRNAFCVPMRDYCIYFGMKLELDQICIGYAVWISLRNQGDIPHGVRISVQIHRLVGEPSFSKGRLSHIILYISLDRVSRNLYRILTSLKPEVILFSLCVMYLIQDSKKRLDKRRKVRRIHAKV